jgi:hypothetical protein
MPDRLTPKTSLYYSVLSLQGGQARRTRFDPKLSSIWLAEQGGKVAFPILPTYDPQASRAVIHCLKPRHPTVHLCRRYRW